MICQKCGSQIDDDSVFCTNCGSAVEASAPAEEQTSVETVAQEEVVAENTASAEETPVQNVEFTNNDGAFKSVPPVDEPKKKFPIIPVVVVIAIVVAIIAVFVSCGLSNKSMVKKTIKAIQKEDGEAYAKLLSDEQIKEILKDNSQYDYKDDEDVADYCKDTYCEDKFRDDEFSYKILDENEYTKEDIRDFNRSSDFYKLKSATRYLVKIEYDDEDDGYEYIMVVVGKDIEQGKVLLSDGFSFNLE